MKSTDETVRYLFASCQIAVAGVISRYRGITTATLRRHRNLSRELGNANIQSVELQDLAKEYQDKNDEELLRLALDPTQLTPEASAVLNDELARRRINGPDRLRAFRDEEEQRKEELRKDTGKLFVFHPYGFGRGRFGKAERIYDPITRMERFKTTVFIVLFWLPLIPTGTFLVQRERTFLPNQISVLKRLPLDWEQVLRIWVVTAGTLLALIWILKLLPFFLWSLLRGKHST